MLVARVAILAWLAGCSSSSPTTPRSIDDTPLRIRIARAEARRADGITELGVLAKTGSQPERVLALRGLGRIGGPRSFEVLILALSDPDAVIVGAAASAIGLATSLDEDDAGAQVRSFSGVLFTSSLLDALARHRTVAVIEAIGRAADPTAQAVLVGALVDKPEIAAAAAFALGRHGRRKLALVGEARDALVTALAHGDARVRYAAAYALAREQAPGKPGEPKDERWQRATAPLARLIADADAQVRAIAVAALARRKSTLSARTEITRALNDADWRVAVEAVRALSGEGLEDQVTAEAAFALMRWVVYSETSSTPLDPLEEWKRSRGGRPGADWLPRMLVGGRDARVHDASAAQVVVEGLRALMPRAANKMVGSTAILLEEYATESKRLPALTRDWIACLATALAIRGTGPLADYDRLQTRCKLPDHLKLPLVGELVGAKIGPIEKRRAALRPLLIHADARVRVAGMAALAAMWSEGDAADHRATAATIIAALGAKDPLVAGSAVEAATVIYEADAKKPSAESDWRLALDAAVIARANTEQDPELAGALFDLIAKRVIAPGLVACRAGLRGAPVLAKAATACMKALGQPTDPPVIGNARPPPSLDVAQVIGKQLRWRLVTTRGEIVIELSPETAPWAVTMIATLTRQGFYNGLEFHRVVPNFVVQGGDPTQSGWGGPGFTIPAEPSPGAGFVAGGVGIADAGRDSGGSQWFVMHGGAPHLDGRYTWIGRVVSGQKSADALLIGDSVTNATLEVRDRP